jgi:hypothetical protein
MAKRLTDSNKWNDNWFNDLPADIKLVWLYILDACDHAGVYKVSFKSIKFYTGTERHENEIIEYLKERIYIAGDKWFIPKFITFQYKNFFTSNTPAIKSARELLISHNIIKANDNTLPTFNKELDNHSISLIEPLDKDYIRTKDMDKDIDKDNDMDKVKDMDIEKDNIISYKLANKLLNDLCDWNLSFSMFEEALEEMNNIGFDRLCIIAQINENQIGKIKECVKIRVEQQN